MSDTGTAGADALDDGTDFAADLAAMEASEAAGAEDEAPPEAADPEPEAAPEAEKPAEKPDPRRGLIAELQEERQRRRAAETERQKLMEDMRLANERLAKLFERGGAPEARQEPQIPDVDTDPVGHFKAITAQQQAELAAIRAEREMMAQRQQFVGAYQAAAQEFQAQAPDWPAAYQHAVEALKADAAFFGLHHQDVEANIVQAALRAGKNPAAAIYEFAKARGYGGPKPTQPDPERTMETLERGAQASRGVAAAAGKAPPAALTMEYLAGLSVAEFDAIMAKRPDAVRRAMGG